MHRIMGGALAATMFVLAGACHSTPQAAPAPQLTRVRVETTKGAFVVELNRAWAPIGVDRFLTLVRAHFFDDSRFFRVHDKFIAQFGIAGKPAVTREWNGRYIADDSVRTSNVRGTVAFAMTGPNLRNTQVFVSTVNNSRLDAQGFAPIGRVMKEWTSWIRYTRATAKTRVADCAPESRNGCSTKAMHISTWPFPSSTT